MSALGLLDVLRDARAAGRVDEVVADMVDWSPSAKSTHSAISGTIWLEGRPAPDGTVVQIYNLSEGCIHRHVRTFGGNGTYTAVVGSTGTYRTIVCRRSRQHEQFDDGATVGDGGGRLYVTSGNCVVIAPSGYRDVPGF
jgi:hypothetical protein